MASDSPKRIYEFGPFQIDLDRYLLMRDGKLVPLSPKVFETLIFLIENRGSVVKKDDIMSRVCISPTGQRHEWIDAVGYQV